MSSNRDWDRSSVQLFNWEWSLVIDQLWIRYFEEKSEDKKKEILHSINMLRGHLGRPMTPENLVSFEKLSKVTSAPKTPGFS